MLSVMLHRYDKRRGQPTMFGDNDDPEPSRPVTASSSVYEAARLHLLQRFDRPYYYGIDDLCDASSENAEQFLQLAAVLVETAATQIIRSKPALLTAETQHRVLRKRGDQIIEGWNFPQHLLVRRLVTEMARRCVEVTTLANGWLTPNAFGVLQKDFEALPTSHPDLAHVLQFGVALQCLHPGPAPSDQGEGVVPSRARRHGHLEARADPQARWVRGEHAARDGGYAARVPAMSTARWDRCIYHRGGHTEPFLRAYLGESHRQVLILAGAGFDPRSTSVAELVARHAGTRARGFFFREERPRPAPALVARADSHERELRELLPSSTVVRVDIFAPDNAVVGARGRRPSQRSSTR